LFAVTSNPSADDPIGDQVPVADAMEQRQEVDETPPMSEHSEPTEVHKIATEAAPEDANPADWQEQRTTAPDVDWDADIDS
jgi:hypothetical protein